MSTMLSYACCRGINLVDVVWPFGMGYMLNLNVIQGNLDAIVILLRKGTLMFLYDEHVIT